MFKSSAIIFIVLQLHLLPFQTLIQNISLGFNCINLFICSHISLLYLFTDGCIHITLYSFFPLLL